jgi:hypothetical protein
MKIKDFYLVGSWGLGVRSGVLAVLVLFVLVGAMADVSAANKLQIWRNASTGSNVSWIDNNGDWFVLGDVTANAFIGDGSGLTNLNVSEIELTEYVPYTGAISNLVLGDNNFSVGGSDLFVDGDLGRVGIGTASPRDLLHISSNAPAFKIERTDRGSNEKVWRIAPDGEDLEIQTQTDAYGAGQDAMIFDRTGTTIVDISFPNGNVGIGTSAPGTPLQVVGAVQGSGLIRSTGGTATGATGPGVEIQYITSGGGYALLDGYDRTASDYIPLRIDGKNLSFHTSAGTSDMFIEAGGNVGIGTTNPGAKLAIQGTGTYNSANWGTASDMAIRSSEMSDDAYHSILQLVAIRQSLTTGKDSQGYLGFSTIDDSNAQGMLDAGRIAIVNEVGGSRNSATALSFWTNLGGAVDTVAATEKVRITSIGNVGIGTTNPQNELNVVGNANITGAMIVSSMNITVESNGDVNVW